MQSFTLNKCDIEKVFYLIENKSFEEFNCFLNNFSNNYILKLLLEARKPLDDKNGDSLCHVASRLNKYEVLKFLIASGVNVTLLNIHKKQPLHEAAQAGSVECLNLLLKCANIKVDALKRADWTSLMLACANVAQAEINDDVEEVQKYVTVCSLLLNAGANPLITNKDGWNSLQIAVRSVSANITKLLLNHGNIKLELLTHKSNNQRTVLHTVALAPAIYEFCDLNNEEVGEIVKTKSYVIMKKLCDIAGYLISIDANLVKAKDSCGTLPLMDALRKGNTLLASVLFDAYERLESCKNYCLFERDKLGYQAVHICAEAGKVDSLRFVTSHIGELAAYTATTKPANESVMSISGCTDIFAHNFGLAPLHLACRQGHVAVIEHILTTFDAYAQWRQTETSEYEDKSSIYECSSVETNRLLCQYNLRMLLDDRERSPLWYAVVGAAGSVNVGVSQRVACIHLIGVSVLTLLGKRILKSMNIEESSIKANNVSVHDCPKDLEMVDALMKRLHCHLTSLVLLTTKTPILEELNYLLSFTGNV